MLPQRDIRNPYSVLIEDLVKLHLAALTDKEMKDSVELFREQIASNRVMSYIKDICGLINILEARNVLSPQHVDSLIQVSVAVKRPLALKRIEDYKRSLFSSQIHINNNPLYVPSVSPTKVSSQVKDDLTDKVFLEVAKLLGEDVRSFARALPLGLNENEIQNLINNELQSKEYQKATLKVLKLLQQKDPNVDNINQTILKALKFIKRGGICQKIELIIKNNI